MRNLRQANVSAPLTSCQESALGFEAGYHCLSMMIHPTSNDAFCPRSQPVKTTSFLPMTIFLANTVAARKSILAPSGGLFCDNIFSRDLLIGFKLTQAFYDQIGV